MAKYAIKVRNPQDTEYKYLQSMSEYTTAGNSSKQVFESIEEAESMAATIGLLNYEVVKIEGDKE